eukprot:m.8827 g.8827  ORF g.8827 m.8827 type:complete len:588 (-) comp9302_c0_seq2:110-1873(-)
MSSLTSFQQRARNAGLTRTMAMTELDRTVVVFLDSWLSVCKQAQADIGTDDKRLFQYIYGQEFSALQQRVAQLRAECAKQEQCLIMTMGAVDEAKRACGRVLRYRPSEITGHECWQQGGDKREVQQAAGNPSNALSRLAHDLASDLCENEELQLVVDQLEAIKLAKGKQAFFVSPLESRIHPKDLKNLKLLQLNEEGTGGELCHLTEEQMSSLQPSRAPPKDLPPPTWKPTTRPSTRQRSQYAPYYYTPRTGGADSANWRGVDKPSPSKSSAQPRPVQAPAKPKKDCWIAQSGSDLIRKTDVDVLRALKPHISQCHLVSHLASYARGVHLGNRDTLVATGATSPLVHILMGLFGRQTFVSTSSAEGIVELDHAPLYKLKGVKLDGFQGGWSIQLTRTIAATSQPSDEAPGDHWAALVQVLRVSDEFVTTTSSPDSNVLRLATQAIAHHLGGKDCRLPMLALLAWHVARLCPDTVLEEPCVPEYVDETMIQARRWLQEFDAALFQVQQLHDVLAVLKLEGGGAITFTKTCNALLYWQIYCQLLDHDVSSLEEDITLVKELVGNELTANDAMQHLRPGLFKTTKLKSLL